MKYVHGAMVVFFVVAALTGILTNRAAPGFIKGFTDMFANLARNTNGA